MFTEFMNKHGSKWFSIIGILIIMIGSYSFAEAQTTLMVTVAPVGIMAVTFASQYKINAEAVAQSVLWSFLMSILFIPILGLLGKEI